VRDALALASAQRRAVRSKMRRRSSFAATPRMAKPISAKSDVVSRYGSASYLIPVPARCIPPPQLLKLAVEGLPHGAETGTADEAFFRSEFRPYLTV
jgi:hypothetical protein